MDVVVVEGEVDDVKNVEDRCLKSDGDEAKLLLLELLLAAVTKVVVLVVVVAVAPRRNNVNVAVDFNVVDDDKLNTILDFMA